MGGVLVNNSVSKIFNKQFNNSDKVERFSYGNLTKKNVAATQQYFRCLLPDSRIPGYVQYFVQDPFIVHMYSSKQINLLKFIMNQPIKSNLDATGSIISKPSSCINKIFYYALRMQHPEYATSRIPVAEMISSDHGTAEISHFLNT